MRKRGFRRKRCWLGGPVAVAFWLAVPAMASAQQAEGPAEAGGEARAGDALGDALQSFGRRNGFDIVFPEQMVRGLTAGRVDPHANPYRALEQLLRGTGLVARFTRPNAVVLERAQSVRAPDMRLDNLEVRPPALARAQEYQWYGQRLLDESLQVLRKTAGLAARSYGLFIYLWVDAEGRVVETRVYGGRGEQREADLVAATLKGLAMQLPPPADMPQPVGLRIAAQ